MPKRQGSLRSLRNRNFRLYLTGQGLSRTGLWFQQTAEIWLILQLTGSGTAVGMHSVLRYTPLLLFGIPAGLLSDRLNRRRLLIVTQSVYAAAAAVLAVASFQSSPSLYLIYGMVLTQGLLNAVDNPLRRSFVRDLVTDADLANAVSLNSSVATVTRTVGPAIGGMLIVHVGVAWCFAVNAVSYGAVILSLLMIDRRLLRPARPVTRAPGQLREGFRYARQNRRIRRTLTMVVIMSVFVWNWNVILPVYSTEVFHGDASLFGWMLSAFSVGSFLGALAAARVMTITGRFFRITGSLAAVSLAAAAAAPVLPVAFVALAMLGASGTAFMIGAQTRLQLEADDTMSGRILALFSVGFIGTRPVGGIMSGWTMDLAGGRAAFGLGAVAMGVLAITLIVGHAARHRDPAGRSRVSTTEAPVP